jgi:hypothetical protein
VNKPIKPLRLNWGGTKVEFHSPGEMRFAADEIAGRPAHNMTMREANKLAAEKLRRRASEWERELSKR